MQIAIDGPAGAGKSSVAREIARRLKIMCLDTGAMYRAITLKALNEKVDLNKGYKLAELARSCNMEIKYHEKEGTLIFLDGEDVTEKIRSPQVNKNVSAVAKSPELRKELVSLQRRLAENSGGIVMEGRDIGTNVLINADFKFFLTASLEERTKRRWLEMKAAGMEISFEDLREEIAMRDRIDQERSEDPLKIAPDALIVDTTSYTLEEVVDNLLEVIRNGKIEIKGQRR